MISSEIIGSAFIMGIAGSLHCIGMCGPLALALPVSHPGNFSRIMGGTVYNAGRILTYAAMGIVFGSAGKLIIASHWLSRLSLALGIIILLYLLIPKRYFHFPQSALLSKPFIVLRKQLGKLFQSKIKSSLFFIGILNGLLPCGLVFLALTSSVITGSSLNGGLFMIFFGLGTFPAMMATIVSGNYINQQLRLRINKALPVLLFVMAALLILRGMNLGIPFISPSFSHEHAPAIHCK